MEIIEFIIGLIWGAFYYFFGAFIGLIWPTQSPVWARWQRFGLTLGVISVLAIGVALALAWFSNRSNIVWSSTIVGLVSLGGYMIIGNVCRRFHEDR